jgi:histone-lysine N-methyltransferase SETD3
MLKGSPLHQMVLAHRKTLKHDFDLLSKKFDQDEFSYEEFVNSKIAVSSRIFGIKIKGEDTVALVPYADMFNHNRPCQTKWYYDENLKGFCIKATEEMARGDQIYDTYGLKSNAEFFMNYGFLIPENEQNTYAIRIRLEPTDPQYYIKCLLAKATNPSQDFLIVATLDDNLMFKFVSWVRFVVFDEDNDIDENTKINLEVMIKN